MTEHVVPKEWPDCIAFDRLHALAARGYKAKLGATKCSYTGFSSVEMSHLIRSGKKGAPPRITLWSNGVVSTDAVLWPEQYVQQEGAQPDWQRFIDAGDEEIFAGFLKSVPLPSVYDKFAGPVIDRARVIVATAAYGAALCVILALGCRLLAGPLMGRMA